MLSQSKKTLALSQHIEKSWRRITQETTTNLRIAQDTSDFTIWHFLIFGLPRPFQGGEYYGTIRFYEGFPETQPSLNICTPNGRVDLNTDLICFSEDDWAKDKSPLRCINTLIAHFQNPYIKLHNVLDTAFEFDTGSIQNLALISKTVNNTNRKCIQLFGSPEHQSPRAQVKTNATCTTTSESSIVSHEPCLTSSLEIAKISIPQPESSLSINSEELSLSTGGIYTPRPDCVDFNEKLEAEREEILQFLKDQTVILLAKLINQHDVHIPSIRLLEDCGSKLNGIQVVKVGINFSNNNYLQIAYWGDRVLEEEFREKSRRIIVSLLDSLMTLTYNAFNKRIVFADLDFTNTGSSMRAIFNGSFGKNNIHRETEIERLNLSRTSTSANALENLFRLTNLQELYLDYCGVLSQSGAGGGGKSVFSILTKKDPILKLRLLSVIGTSSALSHTWLSELGPACPNIQHIYFTRKRGTKSLGWQDIILLQTMRKPILLPCGHIGDNSSIKIGYCGYTHHTSCPIKLLDRVPFTNDDVIPLEPMISYLCKSRSAKWSVHVVDYLRHPLDSKTYYHRGCNHFFNLSSLKQLYKLEDPIQIKELNQNCIVCQQPCSSLRACFPHSVEIGTDTQQFEDLQQRLMA